MRIKINKKNVFNEMIKTLFNINLTEEINGITIDSRKVEKGDLFIPLKGNLFDGHNYISNAIENGASLVFSEIDLENLSDKVIRVKSAKNAMIDLAKNWRNKFDGEILGITGSNGKTTTKELIGHILSQNINCQYSKGNHNNTIGMPMTLMSFNPNSELTVLEMGSNSPGEITFLCEIAHPTMGLITNVNESHIEFFNTIENISIEKSALFHSLPEEGTAFVNLDDPYISTMDIKGEKITYSFNSNADFKGNIDISDNSSNLIINGTKIKLSTGSETMAQNIIAAFSIANHLGVSEKEIVNAIETFKVPPGRGEIFTLEDYIIIDDTYNASPSSAKAGIKLLSKYKSKNRRIVVIGDMKELGAECQIQHEMLGLYITEHPIDAVFAIGKSTSYMVDIIQSKGGDSWHFSNKKELSYELKRYLQPGDVIYFKGSRSMEMESIIKEVFSN